MSVMWPYGDDQSAALLKRKTNAIERGYGEESELRAVATGSGIHFDSTTYRVPGLSTIKCLMRDDTRKAS
jgi:hypothetical protein